MSASMTGVLTTSAQPLSNTGATAHVCGCLVGTYGWLSFKRGGLSTITSLHGFQRGSGCLIGTGRRYPLRVGLLGPSGAME